MTTLRDDGTYIWVGKKGTTVYDGVGASRHYDPGEVLDQDDAEQLWDKQWPQIAILDAEGELVEDAGACPHSLDRARELLEENGHLAAA